MTNFVADLDDVEVELGDEQTQKPDDVEVIDPAK